VRLECQRRLHGREIRDLREGPLRISDRAKLSDTAGAALDYSARAQGAEVRTSVLP
jgi:hypothetical protein